jgi:CheY-like chemotaxis protein
MAQLSNLLLFDPDPGGLDTLTFGFEREGCSVTGTSDPGKARDLIHNAAPPLLLVSLHEPERAGLDLIRATTSNPRTRNLACVAMGRPGLRAQAQGSGAFGFLATPLFVRDALGACRLVAAAVVPGSRPSPEAEISIKLSELHGLYYLVRALAVAGRTAVVDLQRDRHRAELRFMDGVLTSAQLGPLQGFAALHLMLLWEEADLRFRFRHVARRSAQFSLKAGDLTDECERFLRDFSHEVKDLGVARTVYLPDSDRAPSGAPLPGEVAPVLKLVDGVRDLGQIIAESPFRIFDTLKIIKRLADAGAIKASQPAPARAQGGEAAGAGPSLDAWFQRPSITLGAELGRRGEAGRGAAAQPAEAATPAPAGPPHVAAPAGPALARPPAESHTATLHPERTPFVAAIATRPTSTATSSSGADVRPKITTQRQHSLEARLASLVPNPFAATGAAGGHHPLPSAGAVAPPAQAAPSMPAAVGVVPTSGSQAAPPAAQLHPAKSPPAPAETEAGADKITPPPAAEKPPGARPAPIAARGEIVRGHVTRGEIRGDRRTSGPPAAKVIVSDSPSVLIDLGPDLGPLPAEEPAPVAAPVAVPDPAPSRSTTAPFGIPASAGPGAVTMPVAATPPPTTPPPAAPAAPPAAAAPPAPATAAVVPTTVVPAAAGDPLDRPTPAAPTDATKDSARSSRQRRARTPTPLTFNALEADFFEREADLYKRDAVESFDDLDGNKPGGRGRGGGNGSPSKS